MNAGITLKTSGFGSGDGAARSDAWPARGRMAPASIALWAFIGVAGMLFSLFAVAYVLRAQEGGWTPIRLPPQLWLSSALLAAASVFAQLAAVAARKGRREGARQLLLGTGACAVAFLVVQGAAWHALLSAQVAPAGNAAASFFYLLTAMHGLHVAGALALWAVTLHRMSHLTVNSVLMTRICARYLHFLLAVWAGLFAMLALVTPEVARAICGVA